MLQDVIARCFEYESQRLNSPECYFNSISSEFLPRRDKIVQALKECEMKPVVPDGGYFILADYSQLGLFLKTKVSFYEEEKKFFI
jgi:kynurenine--oxoglutarate transaminase/cysteine-S-conjugate beta-lyase/glutamine--phenylpyruvate transaminase